MDSPALDDIDRSLIHELTVDGRATYAKLAPIVGLSQAAVRTRVQRLLDDGVVVITGRVDPATFGMGVFTFAFLEVSGAVAGTAAKLAQIDEAVFVAIGSGRFDMLVELRCADDEEMFEALDRVRATEGVRRLQSATVLHYDKQDWSGVGDRNAVARPAPDVAPGTEIDDIDRMLLRGLIADGRATYASLAPQVGLSQAAVRDRVIDLIDSNVIAIEAHPVAEAVGIGGFAALMVKATGPIAEIGSSLAAIPETTLVARTLGRFDLSLEVWFDDRDHLADVLERVRATPAVGTVDTFPYLRISKEQFGPGPRA